MVARVCLVAVLLAGCESATMVSGVPSAPAGGTVPTSPPSSVGSPAALTSAAASAPGAPPGMPVFPGATSEAVPSGTPWASAAWSVEADAPDVYAYYLEQLPAAGYVIDLAAPGGAAAVIRFTTGERTSYQLDLSGTDPVRITFGSVHD